MYGSHEQVMRPLASYRIAEMASHSTGTSPLVRDQVPTRCPDFAVVLRDRGELLTRGDLLLGVDWYRATPRKDRADSS